MTSELGQKLYHERQQHQLCLLHALNNAFQRPEFTKAELDQVCENFSLNNSKWFNPHRSWIGLGNYDVNVLLSALQLRGLSGVWFDRRLSATQINQDKVVAYIFNVPSTSFMLLFNGRHWFTVLRRGSSFFNLDSKLHEPVELHDFVLFANKLLADGNQLFLVTKPEDVDSCVKSPDENATT